MSLKKFFESIVSIEPPYHWLSFTAMILTFTIEIFGSNFWAGRVYTLKFWFFLTQILDFWIKTIQLFKHIDLAYPKSVTQKF